MSVKPETVVVPFSVFVDRRERRRRVATFLQEEAPIDPAAPNSPVAADDRERWADDGGTDHSDELPKPRALRLTDRSR
jgi:hypothetical protein